MKNSKYIITLILSTALILNIGCSTSASCDTNNTYFNQIFTSTLTLNPSITQDVLTYIADATSAYNFTVSSNQSICQVGLKADATLNTPYLIEIINNTNSTLLYSGTHSFSSSATSYVSVGQITVSSGNSYSIKATQTGTASNSKTYFRCLGNTDKSALPFPRTSGSLTITGSYRYYPNLAVNGNFNQMIPYIDIVFQ